MNNENYNHIIDKAYDDYMSEYLGHEDVPTKEVFVHEIKTNPKFSERWGLKIEERELSLNDRILEFAKRNLDPSEFRRGGNYGTVIPKEITLEVLNNHNIPTKLITVSYKNKTIESYE